MKNNIVAIIIFFALFMPAFAFAAIAGVTVTAATPTNVSTGQPYYLASDNWAVYSYEFLVNIINPTATQLSDYDYVDLVIPLGGGNTITARWTAPVAAGNGTFALVAGSYGASSIEAADGTTVTGTPQNLTLHFRITFSWDIPLDHNDTPAARIITATATDDDPSSAAGTTIAVYGFCNRVKILNFAQDGEALDGLVNPYAADFHVTGTVAYNIVGATDAVPATSINQVGLWRDNNNDGISDNNTGLTDSVPAFSFTVDPGPDIYSLGQTYWRIRVTLKNPNASTTVQDSANSLPVRFDRVLVTSMVVTNPGLAGRDDGNVHWRSTLVPGTQITLTASMQNSGAAMQGDTVFEISGGPNTFTITIPNGSTTATVVIPANAMSLSGSNTYTITQITGSMYGNQTGDSQIRDTTNYPASYYTDQTVWWDNANSPNGGAAISGVNAYPSPTSLIIEWTPVNTSTASSDGDFYEYRVYIRKTGAPTWNQWDGDDDALLRDVAPGAIVNNPNGSTNNALHFTSTGKKYTIIPNLEIFTEYEFYITAVDIFGNETPVPGLLYTTRTPAYSVEVAVTDGITTIDNTTFITGGSPANYNSRQLRAVNIRLNIKIITSSNELPDNVRVWYTNNPSDGGDIDIVIPGPPQTPNTAAFSAPNVLESANAIKTGPNTWVAYLPTTSSILRNGNQIRFVVETTRAGTTVFSDLDMSDNNSNNNEWSFLLTDAPITVPWPTRILNNVITDKNPTCYPAYYLTDDAYVEITVYDIKGRPVAKLLDNAFRKGGQNIKEGGWNGTNKANNKLGVGLYYIHIRAKRVSDGKVILNSFQKVVIAK
ncbi:MAG: fibronectin type III domain-containing protein [Spirochaetota bacterium]|nr:fibronectin type III domain-containing protein [Spirochaetota bacterium]